jgi:hypothetical protein
MRRRWFLLIGLLALGACTADGPAADDQLTDPRERSDVLAESVLTVPPPEFTEHLLPLAADVVRNPGGAASIADSTLLIPGYPGSALIAFRRDVVDECLESATLSVDHLGGTAVPVAWVSLEDGLAAVVDGGSLGSQVIASGSPSSRPDLADGRYTWDVTELLKWSLEHQPDGPFVVALKPEFPGLGLGDPVELGSGEGGAAAELTVTERGRCP